MRFCEAFVPAFLTKISIVPKERLMKTIAKGKFNARDLFFSVAAFVQGSALLSSFFVGILKQNSWIGVVVAYLISLLVLLLLFFLLSKHRGMGLIELNKAVFGKAIGSVVSLLYFIYFYSLVPLNTSDVNGFMATYMMPETPSIVISILFMLVAILTARKGIDAILRLGGILSIQQLIVLVGFTLLLLPNVHLSNMLPLFDITPKAFLQGTNIIVALPFLELIVFMMFVPMLAEQKKAKKALLGGFSLAAGVMIIIVLTDTAVLGPLLEYFTLPRLESARLINVYDVISRMDTLYALVLIVLRYFKVSILLYASAQCLAMVFGLKNWVPLVSTLGVLAAIYSLFVFKSDSDSYYWGQHTAAVYSSFFNIVLPLLTLLVYLIRSLVTKLKSKKPKLT